MRALRELPLLIGVGLGLTLLRLRGQAWDFTLGFEGYRWPDYVAQAWTISQRLVQWYDDFRTPVHGGLVALIGDQAGSYEVGAVVLSSLALSALVIGAGLAVRALSNPWAGALAALSLPLVPNTADAARWANAYPLLAGASGLGLALAAAAARWPLPGLALAAGLSSGLAWAVDPRGLAFVPGCLLLVLCGHTRPTGGGRGLLVLPAFVVGLLLASQTGELFGGQPDTGRGLDEKVAVQAQVVHRWISTSDDSVLVATCEGAPLLTPAYLRHPCAPETLRHNLQVRVPKHLPFGPWPTLLALPLLLLPGKRGWRGVGESGALLVGLVAGGGILALLTPIPDRYMVQQALGFSLIVPLGVGRLLELIPGRYTVPVGCGLVALAATQVPHEPLTALMVNPEYIAFERASKLVESRLGPQDRFLDCSGNYVNLQLLPEPRVDDHLTGYGRPSMNDGIVELCLRWSESPDRVEGAGSWMAVDATASLQLAGQAPVVLQERLERSGRWEQEEQLGAMRLWRWSGP